MALNYETLIHAASKSPEQRTTTEINDFIFPWLKQSLKKKQGIFQKISDDVIHDICKTIMIERRPAWDVVILQGDPGDTFYIILQGSVKIYRLDEEGAKPVPPEFDTVIEFAKLDAEPAKREEIIVDIFGNYVVTLGGGFDFGERALVTNEPRSATVITVTPADLLVVDREVFSRTLKAAHEKELQEKMEFINRCPLFSSWSARLKRLVSLSLERGRYSYDSVLYKQGLRADAVYFIWSGEVKLSTDPLLHWLQYPYLLPQSDPMKQRALELFSPMLQPSQPSNVHIPSDINTHDHRKSFAIKRRNMTFAQAENERSQRILQLALLGAGDIIGLECYVCDLTTYMNSARCTAPCDLFYILKHNFARLQKRYSTQVFSERLREMVLLSLQAYSSRIIQSPLFTALIKKKLTPKINDERQQYHNKQSWLLHLNNASNSQTRRAGTTTVPQTAGKERSMTTINNSQPIPRSARHASFTNPATIQYVVNDNIRVGKIEDRLKQWHAQMGEDSKIHIIPLTRYNIAGPTTNDIVRITPQEAIEVQSNDAIGSPRMLDDDNETISPMEIFVNVVDNLQETLSSYPTTIPSYSLAASRLPPIHIYSKEERYENLKISLKQKWKDFIKRPIPTVY
ncbi:unnamed protein product [Adineta steineri]|uniref:Cyclic nucleotide-binding domain-containing protein n=1 Tax=Adineta steineri TaxID=433720 RepID=A0A813XBM6_9BILA|nr:unnamed protein product [Adineta steineri]